MDTKNVGEERINEQHRGKLATVSYEWVSTVTRKRPAQSSCFQTLIKYLKLYCKHSTLVGLKYLVEEGVTWIERILWIAVYGCTIWLVFTYTWTVYQEYVDTPISTSLANEVLPTEELDFPAVAICTVNKISFRSAKKLATDMFNANISTWSVDEILSRILQIGDLYETSFMTDEDYTDSIELLMNFYGEDYDMTDVIKRLTPQCSEILLLCSLYGENRNCSDLFTMQQTQEGFCCMFNYASQSDEIIRRTTNDKKSPLLRKVRNVGLNVGLNVVMDPMLDDYFYPVLPMTGWKVMIFNPHDYPDTVSGGVTEILVGTSVEKYLMLHAVGMYSTEAIRSYPIEKRQCIFENEKVSIYSKYSGSDCVLACKMEDLWRVCKCRPFFYPSQGNKERTMRHFSGFRGCHLYERYATIVAFADVILYRVVILLVDPKEVPPNIPLALLECPYSTTLTLATDLLQGTIQEGSSDINRTCGIQDIYCLSDYKAQVKYIITSEEKSLMDLIKNQNHTLHCHHCYPLCNDMTYIIDSSTSTMEPGLYKTDIFPAINVTNQSILRIFFYDAGTSYLTQDESYRWYEYMSDAGGLIALFIGFSLISVAELFYFNALLLLDLLKGADSDPRMIRKDKTLHEQPSERAIYWNELFPRSKSDVEKFERHDFLL